MSTELAPAERQLARQQFANEVRSGRIQRPSTCSACGIECVPHGHHKDYSKPLDVVWLCALCHRKEHRPPEDLIRTEKAQAWLKPKEKALCMLLADQEGMSFSDWVRRAMLRQATEKPGKGADNGLQE